MDNPANLISLDGQVWLEKPDIERMVLDMAQGRNPEMPFDERLEVADGDIRRFTMRFNWSVDQEVGTYELKLGFDAGQGACVLETRW